VRLLRLYPRAWRQRYEAEMRALLDEHEVTMRTRLDLLRGALDASLFDRRFAVNPTASALRGVRLGLVPCVFVVAQFLLGLDLHADSTLFNLLGTAIPVSLAVVCLWVGKREAERGTGGRRDSSPVRRPGRPACSPRPSWRTDCCSPTSGSPSPRP